MNGKARRQFDLIQLVESYGLENWLYWPCVSISGYWVSSLVQKRVFQNLTCSVAHTRKFRHLDSQFVENNLTMML